MMTFVILHPASNVLFHMVHDYVVHIARERVGEQCAWKKAGRGDVVTFVTCVTIGGMTAFVVSLVFSAFCRDESILTSSLLHRV